MLFRLGMLAASMLLLANCASKHIATLPPAPVVGVDIVELHKGDVVQFNGTEFSPFYLNQYLQWKNN